MRDTPSAARAVAHEIILALICGVVGTLLLTVALATGLLPPAELLAGLNYVYAPLGLLAAAACYHQIAKAIDIEETTPPPKATWGVTVITIISHSTAAVIGSFALSALMDVVGFPVTEQAAVTAITDSGLGVRSDLLLLMLAAVVLAPIAEEWLMRGLLFARVRRTNTAVAYVVTAVAFAAIHGNPAGFVVYAWLAIVFAHAMARTGRLSAAISVHALNNVITLGMLLGASG